MTVVNDQRNTLDTDPAEHLERPDGGESAGTGNLEKVRDILFGNQMREVDRRFARLEERIIKETRDLRDDMKRRLDALEAHTNRETETLAGQIRQERTERLEGDVRFARELTDTVAAFERRSAAIEEHQAKGQREIRQQMLEQQQHLTDNLREKMEEVLAVLARETQELRTDKTDRQALASLLKEMAMRLTDEFTLPAGDGAGNG
jgi:hypothetical protein